MKKERLNRIITAMKDHEISQMIISDPVTIFYLTGRWIIPGERLLALYLNVHGGHKLVINRLFPQEPISDLEMIWYEDTQDGVQILSGFVEEGSTLGIDKNWPARFLLRLQELVPGARCVNNSFLVDRVRMYKDEQEQELMRKASLLNDQVMEKLIPLTGQGFTEKELRDKARELYIQAGCEDFSFEPIIGFGKNAADPHHSTDQSTGKYGDCVVLDIGGRKSEYASDMTRTVFLGEVSERQKEIYQIVLEANRRGIAAAKPGNRMCDVDAAARNYIEEMGYGPYFTHRTGHSIGLEVHEAGDVSAVNEDVIQPGQCFSVEPGIYLPQEEIGIRIEDLVLITEDGCEVLNKFTKDIIVVPCGKTTSP